MLTEHEIEVRVRYNECDPMGFLHHAAFFVYFEMGRTELLRASEGIPQDGARGPAGGRRQSRVPLSSPGPLR